jgi:hypothetical protein
MGWSKRTRIEVSSGRVSPSVGVICATRNTGGGGWSVTVGVGAPKAEGSGEAGGGAQLARAATRQAPLTQRARPICLMGMSHVSAASAKRHPFSHSTSATRQRKKP